MVQENRIGRQAFVVGNSGGLYGYGLQELFLIDQFDEREALLNGSLDSRAVGSDVTK